MSKLLIKTEVWLVNGDISVQLAESSNVLHEGNSTTVGNNFVYKGDDDNTLFGQYVTNLTLQKMPEPVDIKLGEPSHE